MNVRAALIVNGLCALLLAWLYGGDALDSVRAQSAEVSAYLEPPNLVFALLALVATAVGFGATVMGFVQKKERGWRGFRLMPIVLVVVLFIDLFFFSASKSPLSAADRTALTVQSFAEAASQASTPEKLPTSPRELQTMVEQFGAPPYLLQGQPAKSWTVAVREGCTGPVNALKGEPLGTLFYCLAADQKSAWITAVALPLGTFFGAPQLFGRVGEPVVGMASVRPSDDGSEGATDEEPLVAEPPWLQTPDSGR